MRLLVPLLLALALAGCTGQQGAVQEPPATTPTGSATPPATQSTPPTTPPTLPPPPTNPTPSTPGSVRQLNVSIQGAAFSPPDVTVTPGSTVTWTNLDDARHSIALDSNASRTAGPVGKGQQMALTFNDAGEHAYHCEIHPGMKGVVRVEALAPTPPPPAPAGDFKMNISGKSYEHAVLRISLGSNVTWTNLDFEPHEVEADAGAFFASPILLQNDKYAYTFTRAGTFTYHCDFHGMKGTVIVE